MILDLAGLTAAEVAVLSCALDALKDRQRQDGGDRMLSEAAWDLSHALDGEEFRRAQADERVDYDYRVTITRPAWVKA